MGLSSFRNGTRASYQTARLENWASRRSSKSTASSFHREMRLYSASTYSGLLTRTRTATSTSRSSYLPSTSPPTEVPSRSWIGRSGNFETIQSNLSSGKYIRCNYQSGWAKLQNKKGILCDVYIITAGLYYFIYFAIGVINRIIMVECWVFWQGYCLLRDQNCSVKGALHIPLQQTSRIQLLFMPFSFIRFP